MDTLPDNRLVLFPRSIVMRVDRSALVKLLEANELLDGEMSETPGGLLDGHFLAGDRFFQHISFLGCSPALKLVPGESADGYGNEFVHIAVEAGDEVRFLGGGNVRAPRCPQCNHEEADWASLIPLWERAPEVYTRQCPNCGATKPLHMLNWRHTAGFAAASIHIWGVHESEAVPNITLMAELEKLTRCNWDYFYLVGKTN